MCCLAISITSPTQPMDCGNYCTTWERTAALTRQAPNRIAHTHLKDVNNQVAEKVRSGRLTYKEAVVQGMYRPLGQGDVDVADILNTLQHNASCSLARCRLDRRDHVRCQELNGCL